MARTPFCHRKFATFVVLRGMARLPIMFPSLLILGFPKKIALWPLVEIFLVKNFFGLRRELPSCHSYGGGHDRVGFMFYDFVASVMGVFPPFSDFVVSFLNCLNVCPAQLAPNVWVFLHGFEEVCEGVRIEPSLQLFFYLFQAQLHAAQDFVFLKQIAPFPVLSHISRNVRGCGGQFVRITTMAGVRPF
ncbi:hypothetical protein G2W53_039431 [Senna tora]|uniref:Transposase (putative) gypsy type domain-containing protein n=1 Tax=Senna tora TaxID=362788 RepID=A0A834SQP4_9FABA|nr:hypothetical protein G2W53_039431 [Senna tora]